MFANIIITRHYEGVKRCYSDRNPPLSVPDIPVPTRTLNSSVRSEFLNPIVFIFGVFGRVFGGILEGMLEGFGGYLGEVFGWYLEVFLAGF